MANAVCIGGAAYIASATPPPSQLWPIAVTGRPYATGTGCVGGAACATVVYAASGGLSTTYDYIPDPTTFTSPAALNFTCTPATTASTPAAINTCSSAGVVSGSGLYNPSMTAVDTANASTPLANTTTDPGSVLTSTNAFTVNNELQIANTFLENATVGEPYSAVFSVTPGDVGVGGPYKWCYGGAIVNAVCPTTPTGGIPNVFFVNPSSPAISDDPPQAGFQNLTNRGYYQGVPTGPGPFTGSTTATTFQVSDLGNSTTPGCSYLAVSTCHPLTLSAADAPKVFASQGFVANSFSGSLLPFDANTYSLGTSVDLSALTQRPVTPRVTPDGNWVYVAAQTDVSVIDPTTDTDKEDIGFTTSGTTATSPTTLEVEPQQYFAVNTGNSATCSVASPPCSNLANYSNPSFPTAYMRYDAYLLDWASIATPDAPTANANLWAIPDAENPGNLTVPTPALSNSASVPFGFAMVITPDAALTPYATQGWLSLDYGCAPTTTCNTAAPITTGGSVALPALSGSTLTTYNEVAGTALMLGLNGGAATGDPRGNYVYSVQYDQTGAFPFIAITTTARPEPTLTANGGSVGYLPNGASATTASATVLVCQTGGIPTALTVSPDGNRLFILCKNEPTSDYVEPWDVSEGDGSLVGSDTTLTAPKAVIPLTLSAGTGGGATLAENGCTDPIDIKAKAVMNGIYTTRLYVSCYNSDTLVPIEYEPVQSSADAFTVDGYFPTDSARLPMLPRIPLPVRPRRSPARISSA